MRRKAVELSQVTYNAISQSFQALAFVTKAGRRTSFPVEVNAPITTDFERAAWLLAEAALEEAVPSLSAGPRNEARTAAVIERINRRKRRGLPVGQFGYYRGREHAA